MSITPVDETFELLTPSAALLPVLTGLRSALTRLGDTQTKTSSRVWENIPVMDISSGIARFSIWMDGYDRGVIPSDDSEVQNDINHRLSTDYEIMSPSELGDRFAVMMNRASVTSRYRRIAETPDITRLFKDSRALGWQGFDVVSASETEKRLIRNRRMFVDYFRQDFDWTRLRAIELSRAAALIDYAIYMEMVTKEEAEPYARRVTVEAMTRYPSWNTFARALLTAQIFESLNDGEIRALQQITPIEEILQWHLEKVWCDTPWPRLAN